MRAAADDAVDVDDDYSGRNDVVAVAAFDLAS
jgi:hypothetical protein